MKHITSLDNPLIKSVAKLLTKKGRDQHNLFVAEGVRTCTTIIESGIHPTHVFITQEFDANSLTVNPEIIFTVSSQVLSKISSSHTPSGLIGVFPIPQEPNPALIEEGLVLAQVQDPGNMGTLIRTAIAFGKKTIVIVEGVDPWNPKVIQASAGTIAKANIFQLSWDNVIAYKKNLNLIALVVHGGKKPQEITFQNTLLVIGNEAHGIPEAWRITCNESMTIPMPGATESLNAATAGALGMYLAWIHH